jgi:hypothetical protein
MLERPEREKHSSLIGTFVNYGCKKFEALGPRDTNNTLAVYIDSVHLTQLG